MRFSSSGTSPSSLKSVSAPHYQFPYVQFHGKFYPLIPVTLQYRRRSVSTFALLDSGASVSVFRPEIAKALGITLNNADSLRLGTANGGVDVHVVRLNLQIQQTKFKTAVGFSSRLLATFNIIGRDNFFSKFSIAFNEIMKTVVLVPLETIS